MLSLKNIGIEDVSINIYAKNWEDAIEKASKKMLDRGDITREYVTSMINNVRKFGPYIVMTKNVALAHARPEDGAKVTSLHFSTLIPEIEFGSKENDPVKLLIVLSAKDTDSHIKLLAELSKILANSEVIKMLINTDSDETFVKIIKDYV
ncbi:PTS sugar transporter subunit IIA [Miniphocaeibacter halophilus]|uniref:PTS sugar transporter subunit IIA n=1 Tax=Miniphocaeibacter halophilus TaxID=2931922 RepID=A0AC61N130_9FIRM|nr:PTS sugar transporter subunit IIA [Miniphocaeibacter halophilus]QQK08636.1 PTS sugar transporter subunit IIA [Miniphocaeibacter halophilus]